MGITITVHTGGILDMATGWMGGFGWRCGFADKDDSSTNGPKQMVIDIKAKGGRAYRPACGNYE